MKKIFSILSAGLLALAAVSCVTEKPADFDPSKATAPQVLSANVDEGAIVVDFTPAVLGQSFAAPVYHWLILSKADSKEVGKALTTTVKNGTLTVSSKNVKNALADLGYSEGETVAIELILRASLQDPTKDNGINGYIDAENLIKLNYEILASGGNTDPYAGWQKSTWGVTGSIASAGINWDSDIEMFTDGTWHVAKNVVLTAGDQFKFRKDGGWDVNFGAGPDITEEPYVVTIGAEQPAGAGGKNLAVPADGTYDLLVNPDAEVYKVIVSGGNTDPYAGWEDSTWGVTGAIASAGINWDSDIAMVTDGTWHVAKNVVLSANDQFKFRKDHGWDVNFGAGPDITEEPYVVTLGVEQPAGPGGKNLAVPADGTYDLLVNPDAALYKVVASGSSGGGDALPDIDLTEYEYLEIMEGADTWGLIGPAQPGGWDTDTDLEKVSDDPEIWAVKGIDLQADKFKFRGNDTWGDYDLGGGEFAINAPIVMSKGGGDMVAEAGNYNVYLYPTYGVAYITEAGGDTPPPPAKPSVWSLIGTVNDTAWDTDFDLTKVSGDIWRIRNVELKATDEFKLRADHSWNKNVGGPEGNAKSVNADGEEYDVYEPEIGKVFEVGSLNIRVPVEGAYDITFDYAAQTILIEEYVEFAKYIYAIGADTGWSSTYPLHTILDNGNNTANYKGFGYLSGEFKFRPNADDWAGDWEFDGEGKIADNGGSNCPAPDEAGYYMIEVNLKEMTYKLTLITTIGVVGPAQAGGWDADTDLEYNPETGAWEGTLELAAGEMKFRANDAWAINWGGSLDAMVQDGGNITVEAGKYAIQLYAWCDEMARATMTKQ